MSTKQLYEKTSEGIKEVSPLVALEDIYSKLSDTPLEVLVSLYNHVKCEWKGSIAETRKTVPMFLRRSGLFITYNNGTKYITEFFSAGTDQITTENWIKDSNWTPIPDEDYISAGVKPGFGTIGYEQLSDNLKQLFREKVNVTNFPDDEDIASVDNMLKFKDREADAANFQSKGYIILRKNLRLVNGVVKNILTQDMVNQPNTIYEIRYDFDLNGANIVIAENCILNFKGGTINNGVIVGNNTFIKDIIFKNIKFDGTFGPTTINVASQSQIKYINGVYPSCIIRTSGYYKEGDGGSADYIVYDADSIELEPDGDYLITLPNNLVAKMNIVDAVNIKSFGCKSTIDEKNFDIHDTFQKCINVCAPLGYAIRVPNEEFLLNNTIILGVKSRGCRIIGNTGYTFKNNSRISTTRQDDEFIMFSGENNDSIRHCTFNGITFSRDRTKEERDFYNGEGYGRAGTCFDKSTELNLEDCGFIGFGRCFESGSILFCNRTDFSYCNNIINTRKTNVSTIIIAESNMWCNGDLIKMNTYSVSNITFSNVWIEHFLSLITAETNTKTDGINFVNCDIQNKAYGKGHPMINYPNPPLNYQHININFNQCHIQCVDKISTDLKGSVYNITINESRVIYGGSGENIEIGGNSTYWKLENDYIAVDSSLIPQKGINSMTGIVNIPLKLRYKAPSHDVSAFGPYDLIRQYNNILGHKDENGNMRIILPVYQNNGEGNDNTDTSVYFSYNPNPTDEHPNILHLYNRITGSHYNIAKATASTYGILNNRPTPRADEAGTTYYAYDTKELFVWLGDKWIYYNNGFGESINRPSEYIYKGFIYFDTTINKPIWWTGEKWVDATGADV